VFSILNYLSALKKEAAGLSKRSVHIYQIARRHIPAEGDFLEYVSVLYIMIYVIKMHRLPATPLKVITFLQTLYKEFSINQASDFFPTPPLYRLVNNSFLIK
jgi:hypothetical protein